MTDAKPPLFYWTPNGHVFCHNCGEQYQDCPVVEDASDVYCENCWLHHPGMGDDR